MRANKRRNFSNASLQYEEGVGLSCCGQRVSLIYCRVWGRGAALLPVTANFWGKSIAQRLMLMLEVHLPRSPFDISFLRTTPKKVFDISLFPHLDIHQSYTFLSWAGKINLLSSGRLGCAESVNVLKTTIVVGSTGSNRRYIQHTATMDYLLVYIQLTQWVLLLTTCEQRNGTHQTLHTRPLIMLLFQCRHCTQGYIPTRILSHQKAQRHIGMFPWDVQYAPAKMDLGTVLQWSMPSNNSREKALL